MCVFNECIRELCIVVRTKISAANRRPPYKSTSVLMTPTHEVGLADVGVVDAVVVPDVAWKLAIGHSEASPARLMLCQMWIMSWISRV